MKTQAQKIAEHIKPIVENHVADNVSDKQNDLIAVEFIRQIAEGEQILQEVEKDE